MVMVIVVIEFGLLVINVVLYYVGFEVLVNVVYVWRSCVSETTSVGLVIIEVVVYCVGWVVVLNWVENGMCVW